MTRAFGNSTDGTTSEGEGYNWRNNIMDNRIPGLRKASGIHGNRAVCSRDNVDWKMSIRMIGNLCGPKTEAAPLEVFSLLKTPGTSTQPWS